MDYKVHFMQGAIDLRNRLHACFRKSPSPSDWSVYAKQKNQVTHLLCESKQSHYSNHISSKASPSCLHVESHQICQTQYYHHLENVSVQPIHPFKDVNCHFVAVSSMTSPSDVIPLLSYLHPSLNWTVSTAYHVWIMLWPNLRFTVEQEHRS